MRNENFISHLKGEISQQGLPFAALRLRPGQVTSRTSGTRPPVATLCKLWLARLLHPGGVNCCCEPITSFDQWSNGLWVDRLARLLSGHLLAPQ
ncbi:Beta-lactamase [Trichinella pseudospiralis]